MNNRRDFLKMLGFGVSAAAVAAACEIPIRKSIPYVVKPEEITPGIPNYYASAYIQGGNYNSFLVKTREGRPILVEGNPDSVITSGGVNPKSIGSLLNLYDEAGRLRGPMKAGESSNWDTVNSEISLKWNDFGNNIIINNINKEMLIQKWQNYLESLKDDKLNRKILNTSSKIELREILINLLKDYSPKEISLNLNFSKDKVAWWCNKLMIQINREKYNYDTNAFLEVTEQSSYVMGLLTADGYIKQNMYNCSLNLDNTDKYIIEMYKKVLQSNKPICLRKKVIDKKQVYSFDCNNPFVIENIKLQIKKERIELDQITNLKTKEILKKLGFNKYYEHIAFIKNKLGIKPPVFSPELEDTLCNLFMEIQGPYAKYCPDDRVNFLNYYYTVYKLCELLDQTQFLPYFPMLKDREKRIEQDEIWKKICEDLNWEFVPTI